MGMELKERLIDLVQMNPELWKMSRKAPGLKQKIWDNIGTELGTTGYDARRQWEILRDQQRRENKRFKQNPNYKSKWMFYSKMLFTLLKKNVPAPVCYDDGEHQIQTDNDYTYHTTKTEEGLSNIQVRKDLQESNDGHNYLSSVDGYSASSAVAVTNEARIVEDYYPATSAGVSSSTQLPQNYTEDIKPSVTIPSPNKRYSSCPEDDEDYYFAMSLVPSMRCIARSKKLRLRSKILDLIASALEDDNEEENKMSFNEDVDLEDKVIPDHVLETSMGKIN